VHDNQRRTKLEFQRVCQQTAQMRKSEIMRRSVFFRLPASLFCSFFLLLSAADAPVKPGAGSIRCEIWDHLDGGQITDSLDAGDLTRPASVIKSLSSFELNPAPEVPDACAVRGYVVPPATGNYTFFISADDTALLYLSSDQTVTARKYIASVPTALGVRDFKRYSCQTSKPIKLVAGRRYFIEALLKNEDGPSHVSVGWSLPDGTVEAPIPGNRLMPALVAVKPPEAHVEAPKITLTVEKPLNLKPGFHKFVSGAHLEWPTETMDMSYLVFLPNTFDTTQDKRPLLVFLHGNSHQGTDLWGVLNEGPGNFLLNDQSLHDWFPMIGLFPQLPPDWRWDRAGAAQAVNALIKAVCAKYPRIDKRRIYLTGLSMGGKGSWLTALDSPDTFAAMTTFSAVAVRPEQAKVKLASIKNIHIVCGADDGDFAAGSKQMFDVLHTTLGDHVQFTAVEHEGHGVWGRYYPTREFYEELMRFSK
jgi:predicted esterase